MVLGIGPSSEQIHILVLYEVTSYHDSYKQGVGVLPHYNIKWIKVEPPINGPPRRDNLPTKDTLLDPFP